MTVSLKHAFNCAKADGTDVTAVKPSNWNEEHVLTASAGKVIGTPAGSTTVGELPITVDAAGQSMIPPSGTTATRPSSPSSGMMRFNSTTGRLESYSSSAWTPLSYAAARVASAEPTNPYTGDIWLDSDDNGLYVHNGTSFVSAIGDGVVTLAKLASAVQQLLVPSGSITPFAGSSAPTGWLLCYGQAVSRTTYASLYAVLGTTYGMGDGSTTFNLPDLRGRVVAGKDNMGGTSANRLTNQTGGLDGDVLGATGGAETHTLTEAQMPAHNHRIYGVNSGATDPCGGLAASGMRGAAGSSNSGGSQYIDVVAGNSVQVIEDTGGSGAHNNVQPTIVLNYIIKT